MTILPRRPNGRLVGKAVVLMLNCSKLAVREPLKAESSRGTVFNNKLNADSVLMKRMKRMTQM
jgi:hypothetical protein